VKNLDAILASFIPCAAYESLPISRAPRVTDVHLTFSTHFSSYEWIGGWGCMGQPVGEPGELQEYWAHRLAEESITCLTVFGILAVVLFSFNARRALRRERSTVRVADVTFVTTCLLVCSWISGLTIFLCLTSIC
jgi:hypothetical protein